MFDQLLGSIHFVVRGRFFVTAALITFMQYIAPRSPPFILSQWRIYILKFWTHPPPRGPNYFNFSSFRDNLAKSYVGAPTRVGTPPQGNPGSSSVSDRSGFTLMQGTDI